MRNATLYQMYIFSVLMYLVLVPLLLCSDKVVNAQMQQPNTLESIMFPQWKNSERIIKTSYGKLRGKVVLPKSKSDVSLQPIEVFLGIPYASPPIGTLRFLPPMNPAHWDGIKDANKFAPECPQNLPYRVSTLSEDEHYFKNKTRGQRLKSLFTFLKNQSEDCLYLNIYTPASVGRTELEKLPVLVITNLESYSWGSGNLIDASVLCSYSNMIVVTFNFRLGVLGFFPTMEDKSRANNALMDQVAALHWVQKNIEAFGGDKKRVTLSGYGHSGALVHLLMLYPLAKDLFGSAIIMSGCALSSWAICHDSMSYVEKLAKRLECPSDDNGALVDCLRHKSIDDILRHSHFESEIPTHLCEGFGPTIDNNIIPALPLRQVMLHSSSPFPSHNLLFGSSTFEAHSLFADSQQTHGIESETKERILRTLVRNLYDYHQQEIYLSISNEYTDWTRSTEDAIDVFRDAVNAITDATVLSPLVEMGTLHSQAVIQSRLSSSTHFYIFNYPGEACISVGDSCVLSTGDDYPYIMGYPISTTLGLYPVYTRQDLTVSQQILNYWRDFIKTGNPNGASHGYITSKLRRTDMETVSWPQYESIHKMYLFLDLKSRVGNHYNGHRLSLWNRLIPSLHRSTDDVITNITLLHHLLDDYNNASSFIGIVRNVTFPPKIYLNTRSHISTYYTTTPATVKAPVDSERSASGNKNANNEDNESKERRKEIEKELSRRNTSRRSDTEQLLINAISIEALTQGPYSKALVIIVTVGCSLLAVNVLIFIGTFCQHRETSNQKTKENPSAHSSMIKDEDSCMQKTILMKDSNLLYLDERSNSLTKSKLTATPVLPRSNRSNSEPSHDEICHDIKSYEAENSIADRADHFFYQNASSMQNVVSMTLPLKTCRKPPSAPHIADDAMLNAMMISQTTTTNDCPSASTSMSLYQNLPNVIPCTQTHPNMKGRSSLKKPDVTQDIESTSDSSMHQQNGENVEDWPISNILPTSTITHIGQMLQANNIPIAHVHTDTDVNSMPIQGRVYKPAEETTV